MKQKNIFIAAVLSLALTACGNYEYLELPPAPDGTPIEHPGRLLLTDNGSLPKGATARLVDPARGNRLVAGIAPGAFADVEAARYNLLYLATGDDSSLPEGTILDGTVLTLPLTTDDGRLPQLPEITGAATPVTIVEDQSTEAALTVRPLTRDIHLDVRLQGADMNNVRSVEARLDGVGRQMDMQEGYAAATAKTTAAATTNAATTVAAETVSYYLLIELAQTAGSGDATTSPIVSGTFRLPRTDTGATQRLLLTATLNDGNLFTYEQDVTSLLAGFNPPAADTPLRLTATLSFFIDGMTGTITPWTPGWDEGGTGM